MKTPGMRPATPDDIDALLELWRTTQSGPSVTDTPEDLRMLIERAPDLLIVAEMADAIVGSVVGGWDGWRGHIYRLAVHPEHQRRGLATRLLQEIEERLRALGARRIYALALPREAALAFWTRQAYETSDDVPYVRTFVD